MALDIARLGMVVDTSPMAKASSDLTRFAGKAQEVDRAVRKTGGSVDQLGKQSASAAGGVQRLGSSMDGFRRVALAAAGAMGAITGALLGGALVRTSDQYVEMTNSLRVLGMTAEQATDRLSQIGDIARRTRTPLNATAQLYQRVSIASRELGASQDDVMRFTENVGLALAQQGGSAESAAGALMQLSQALAGGVVRAEEFNSILEGAYPIAQAAADGIDRAGGSVGKLRQLMLAGEVTSKQFFDAILSQTPKLSAAFAGTVPTVGQAMQVLRDQWTLAIGQMSGGTSALSTAILRVADGVSAAASAISNNMNQIIGVVTATAAAYTAYMIPAIVSTTTALYAQIAAWVTLRGAMIATGIGAMIVAAGLLIGKFLDLAQAVGGFGNALEAVGEYAAGVLDNMQARVSLLGEAFGAAATYMQGVFLQAFATIARGFADLMGALSAGMTAIGIDTGPGLGSQFAESITKKADDTLSTGVELMKSVGESTRLLNEEASANLKRLSDRLNQAKGVAAAVAGRAGGASGIAPFGGVDGASGGRSGRGGAGGGQSETEKAADKAREALEKLRQEHVDLQATVGMTAAQERIYAAVQELGAGATAQQVAEAQRLVPEIDRLKAAKDRLRQTADTLQQGFRDLFTGVISGAKSAKDAIADLASKLADMMANRAFDSLLAGGLGRFFGGDPLSAALSGAGLSGVRSFAGGGYTWDGPRAGGVDGRGGRFAVLHPRETVIDHTKGGGAMTYAPVFNIGGNVTAEDLAAVRRESLANYHQMQRSMPSQVQRVNRDPLRR